MCVGFFFQSEKPTDLLKAVNMDWAGFNLSIDALHSSAVLFGRGEQSSPSLTPRFLRSASLRGLCSSPLDPSLAGLHFSGSVSWPVEKCTQRFSEGLHPFPFNFEMALFLMIMNYFSLFWKVKIVREKQKQWRVASLPPGSELVSGAWWEAA